MNDSRTQILSKFFSVLSFSTFSHSFALSACPFSVLRNCYFLLPSTDIDVTSSFSSLVDASSMETFKARLDGSQPHLVEGVSAHGTG